MHRAVMSMAQAKSHLLLVDGFVVGMLLGGEANPDNDFLLLRQILNVLLHPAQQKWTQRLLHTYTSLSEINDLTSQHNTASFQ